MQPWLQLVALIVTILGAALGVAVWVLRVISRVQGHLERIELRIGTVEHQNRALLKAFPQVISSLMTGDLMTRQQGSQIIAIALEPAPIDDLLRQIQPTPTRFLWRTRTACGTVRRLKQGDWLTPEEARDFYRLTDTVSREYPSNEGSWLLSAVGGLVLGLILADPKK